METDEAVLRRLQRFALEATTSPIRLQYEAEASVNYQYIENDFYTDEELAEFAERGQPPTKRNEIAPIIERISGQFIQTRQIATFLGRNTPADDQTGAIAQDVQRWVDQINLYEFKEQRLAWHGLVGGVGWVKSFLKRNDLGVQYQCDKLLNPFHVFLDPFSVEYDPNEDAKYIAEGSWMDLEDAIAMWPDQEKALVDQVQSWEGLGSLAMSEVSRSLQNESQIGTTIYSISVQARGTRKRVRPFEIWYKRKVQVYHLFTPDNVLALAIPLDAKEARDVVKSLGNKVVAVPSYQDRMYVGVFLGNLLLHHDVSPHETNLFPYTPFYSDRRMNGAPLALAARLVPINEAINKRESKSLALLTNKQVIAEKGALEDEDEFASEIARPDGVAVVKDGALKDQRILVRDNLDIGQAQMALLQEDKDAIRRVSGHGNESMGMPSEVRSGTGIARKQMMSNLIVLPVQNNLRLTRHLRARLSFAYQRQYLTEEQTFQITDDMNAAKTVAITSGYLNGLKQRLYDIVITDAKDYAVLREQQVDMLLSALPQLAQHGAWMVKLGIQLSDLREKEGLLQMIDAQSQPPPVVPKVNLTMSWPDLTPEIQAFMAIAIWQNPDLAEAIMRKGDDPAFLQKLKATLIATQVKEGTRATVERGKMDLSALQTAVEGRLQLRQFLEKSVEHDMNDGDSHDMGMEEMA
jgi:hypothetical protein